MTSVFLKVPQDKFYVTTTDSSDFSVDGNTTFLLGSCEHRKSHKNGFCLLYMRGYKWRIPLHPVSSKSVGSLLCNGGPTRNLMHLWYYSFQRKVMPFLNAHSSHEWAILKVFVTGWRWKGQQVSATQEDRAGSLALSNLTAEQIQYPGERSTLTAQKPRMYTQINTQNDWKIRQAVCSDRCTGSCTFRGTGRFSTIRLGLSQLSSPAQKATYDVTNANHACNNGLCQFSFPPKNTCHIETKTKAKWRFN